MTIFFQPHIYLPLTPAPTHSSQLFQDIEGWSGMGFEPSTFHKAVWRSTNWANQAAVLIILSLSGYGKWIYYTTYSTCTLWAFTIADLPCSPRIFFCCFPWCNLKGSVINFLRRGFSCHWFLAFNYMCIASVSVNGTLYIVSSHRVG